MPGSLDRESFRNVVARLTELLERAGVDGALIGGLAAAAYTDGRFTTDVDLVVVIEDERLEPFVALASDFGFVERIHEAAAFARQARVLLLKDGVTGIAVDIGLAGLAFEFEAIEAAKPLGPGLGRVIGVEDLLVMKAVAGRDKDILDIRSILSARANLDLARVRALLLEFAVALENDNCVHVFDEAVRDSNKRRSRSGPPEPER